MSGRLVAFPRERTSARGGFEPWVDEGVVARHYSVSTRTVRRWRLAGMPSRLVGGQRRFRIGDTERWHAQRSSA
jgi:hypothetical protein